MPANQGQGGNSQTLCVELSELSFEMLKQERGCATVIRFTLPDETVRMGDTLVVLDGPEIRFHGMISSVDKEGRATASDPRGSSIPIKI
jgi:hypothetical protein